MDARTTLCTAGAVAFALPALAEIVSRIGLWLRSAGYRSYDATDFPLFAAALAQGLPVDEIRSPLPDYFLDDHAAANRLQDKSF